MKRRRVTRTSRALRKAARIVADTGMCSCGCGLQWDVETHGACDALAMAVSQRHFYDAPHDAFAEAMSDPPGIFWWPRDEKHRAVRVLALLFAAEMQERP